MKKYFLIFCFFTLKISFSQDTIKIKRPADYDANCELQLCIKNECFSDSIPLTFFNKNINIELRFTGECTIKKSRDIFVSSFEITVSDDNNSTFVKAESSFMNSEQKNAISSLKKGQYFYIKNVVVHAPDNFRKMSDMNFKLY